jgi:hypothetical protein
MMWRTTFRRPRMAPSLGGCAGRLPRGHPAAAVARSARRVRAVRGAGHSVAVLLKVYAKCLDGATDMANARIEAALGRWA